MVLMEKGKGPIKITLKRSDELEYKAKYLGPQRNDVDRVDEM